MRTLFSLFIGLLVSIATASSQTVQVIYSFPSDGSMGSDPRGSLTVGPGGDLYGTATRGGGANDDGTVFRISTGAAFTMLGALDKATTGRLPYARLITIGDGFLYGVSESNTGTSGDPNGTLFKVDPSGGITALFGLPPTGVTPKFPHALLSVTPGSIHVLGSSYDGFWVVPLNGSQPTSFNFDDDIVGVASYSATVGADGKIYGVCQGIGYGFPEIPNRRGTIYRVDPDGGNLVKLHDCLDETGTTPTSAMVVASDGNFYGTMTAGGTSTKGCVFRLTPGGDYTVIHHFSNLTEPRGDLMQATDGFLYGTALRGGGPTNNGGIFRISTSGAFTQLHAFSGANGANPYGGLAQASDGHLYGTTSVGGAGGKGTIYRVTLNLPPPNRAPVALDDIGVTTGNTVPIDVIANDFDPEAGALTVTEVTTPQFGTATIVNNTVQYDPGINFTDSDSFEYTVRDPAGLTAVAQVTIQSDPVQNVVYSGAFNGLIYLDPEVGGNTDTPRAQIAVAVNELGKVTGVMLTGRKRVKFRGAFDLTDGTATIKVTLPGKGKALLFLGFKPGEEGTLLALVYGREVWSGSARPIIQSVFPGTDKHTVILEESSPNLPRGYGYGLMQIKANGLITCVGKYGDGTKLVWGTSLVGNATGGTPLIPVFSEPVKGGVCAGILDSQSMSSFNFLGSLRWIRPPALRVTLPYSSGFTGETVAGVSRFTPAPAVSGILQFGVDGGGSVQIKEGPLANPIIGTFTVVGPPPPTLRIVPTAPLKSLVINRNTGLITGKMLIGKKPVSFTGVVSPAYNVGFGQFIIGGTSGIFELEP